MPKISVIVPVYNVENYINRCIDSIINQTFTDLEIILINDGSLDNSGKICDEYLEIDERIKVVHKENGGLSSARNSGLELATGEFIGFVDSDDYIKNDMYEQLLVACNINSADISMCGRYNVSEIGELNQLFSLDRQEIWSSKVAIENLLTWNNIDSSVCDKLFYHKLFDHIRFPLGKYNEDIFVMVKILFEANKIVHIGLSKYYYYHRSNSITTEKFSEKKLDLLEASSQVVNFVEEYYPEIRQKAISFHLKGIIYLLSILHKKEIKKRYNNSYKMLKSLLDSSIMTIIFNKYIKLTDKIRALLLYTNLYSLALKIYDLKK